MKTARKHETLQESYERLYGKSVLFDTPSKNRDHNVNPSILILINIIRFIIKFSFSGVHSLEPMRNRDIFMVLSGLFMSSYSIIGMIYMHEIEKFLKPFGWNDGFLTLFMGFVAIFFLVQLSRGVSFMGGYHLFNSGYSNGGRPAAYFGVIHNSSKSTRVGSGRSEIDGFIGYANSRMSTMDNRAKEKYITKLFGGGK